MYNTFIKYMYTYIYLFQLLVSFSCMLFVFFFVFFMTTVLYYFSCRFIRIGFRPGDGRWSVPASAWCGDRLLLLQVVQQ